MPQAARRQRTLTQGAVSVMTATSQAMYAESGNAAVATQLGRSMACSNSGVPARASMPALRASRANMAANPASRSMPKRRNRRR